MCDSEKENSSDKEKKDDENNVVLTNEQVALLQDQRQELVDLRRQVVYLQVSFFSRTFKKIFEAFCAFESEGRKINSKLDPQTELNLPSSTL